MVPEDCASMIDETRRVLAIRRGWLRRVHREDLFTAVPRPDDELRSHLKNQRFLLKRGKVVWAALIQANKRLYEIDPHWYPGEILCSDDPHFDSRPNELDKVCSAIFGLKGQKTDDPDVQLHVSEVTDELTRSFGAPLPQRILKPFTTGANVRRYSLIVDRKHLPERVLCANLMPVLYHSRCDNVMFLPSTAWGPQMLQFWKLPEEVKQQLEQAYEDRERERQKRPLIDVTEDARRQLREIANELQTPVFLRIAYQGGGHTMQSVKRESVRPTDHQMQIDRVTFLMDPESADVIWGCKLDWQDRGFEAGFVFE